MIQLLLSVLLLTSLLVFQIYHQQLVTEIYQGSSNFLFNKITHQYLERIQSQYQIITSNIIFTTQNQVSHVNELYRFIQRSQNFSIQKPRQCLSEPGTNDTYSYSSSQCYGIFNQSNNQKLNEEIKSCIELASLMTQVRQMLNRTQSIYFSHRNDLQFFSISTGVWFTNYYPHARPWYSQHLKLQQFQKNEFVFGNPFQTYAGDIQLPLSKNFTNVGGEFDGVIVQDLNFQFYTALNNNSEDIVLITDSDGLLLFCVQYSVKKSQNKIYYVYNEQITGFNQDDWNQIKNFLDKKQYKNNCSLQIQTGLLCRFNKLLNQDTIILTQNLNNTPYSIIIFQNVEDLQKEETQIIFLINKKLKDTMKQLLLIFLIVIIILLIIQQIMMANIISPLYQIMLYMNKKINSDLKQKNINYRISYLASTTLKHLLESVSMLGKNLITQQKSDICMRIENWSYPNTGYRKIKSKIQIYFTFLPNK